MRPSLAFIAAAGYVIGSVPVANLVARRHGVADLRDVGDHNPGYWNARETIGVRAAAPILVADTVKGAAGATVGAVVASVAGGPWWAPALGGGAAMVGHAFPVFDRFDGGRSVLTFVGSAVVVSPRSATISGALFATAWAATGRFDRAARLGVGVFPVVQLAVDGPRRTAVTGVAMTFVGLRFAAAARAARARSATA